MTEQTFNFELFYNREGFNKSLTHFSAVSELIGDFENNNNLADILNELLLENEIEQKQIPSIIYAILVDKFGYNYKSTNLKESIENLEIISDQIKKWDGIDILISYHHPELGIITINPKNKEHWKNVDILKKNELITIYTGSFSNAVNKSLSLTAIEKTLEIIENKQTNIPKTLLQGKFKFKEKKVAKKIEKKPVRKQSGSTRKSSGSIKTENASVQQQMIQPVKMRMTRQYSVPVSNELFHNGNVEAWKKIIESFTTKHPGLSVYIFYDGERIHDINTLFKWGKVKHGSAIMFAVAGENITDVAKLQRYFRQGASPAFEAFLRFPVNKILNLF